jgi:hypothetical protein
MTLPSKPHCSTSIPECDRSIYLCFSNYVLYLDAFALVMTVGDARVGKSTTARLLVEFYLDSKLKLRTYYTGNRNKLYAYELLLPVGKLPLTRDGADQLLIDLECFSDVQVALSDLPGQNFEQFKQFVEEVLLWDAIASLGYRITFVYPISHRRDCVEYF